MSDENQNNNEKPITLVYISAASHSGSTLSTLLIASHPEICTIGELKATNLGDPNKYRCSCLLSIKECEFWEKISQSMHAKGHNYQVWEANTNISDSKSTYAGKLLKPLVRNKIVELVRDCLLSLSPTWRRELKEKLHKNYSLLCSISEVTGKKLIVDSSKIGLRLKYLLKINKISLKVVRVIRDGRGVALTYINPTEFADAKNKSLRGGGFGGSRIHEELSMAEAAREWRRSNEEAEFLMRRMPATDWITVRYEDICRNTVNELNRIYRFLGVEEISEMPNYRAQNKHLIGNGMRLDSDNVIQLDERWRTQLTQEQLTEFDKIAGDLNRHYGYS